MIRDPYQRDYYQRNRAKRLAYAKEHMRTEHAQKLRKLAHSKWYPKNRSRISRKRWEHRLRFVYGLTPDQYRAMVEAQVGACEICGRKPGYHLCVDHDHETNEVRGLLCKMCNVILGYVIDSPEILEKAAAYLRGERRYAKCA